MVKTLGSARQTLPMRSACARCLANVVKCLGTRHQQPSLPLQSSTAVHGAAVGDVLMLGRSKAQPEQQQQSASPAAALQAATPAMNPQQQQQRVSSTPSPSPGYSPRSVESYMVNVPCHDSMALPQQWPAPKPADPVFNVIARWRLTGTATCAQVAA